MKIYFMGQKGFPAQQGDDLNEKRIEALAKTLAKTGHQSVISSVRSYSKLASKLGNISVVYRTALNPYKPTGWLPLLFDLIAIEKNKPQVVHLHGWKAAALSPLVSRLVPQATIILTLSHLPKTSGWIARWIVKHAQKNVSAITTPNRQLQYELLYYLNLRTIYIPDGYHVPKLNNIPSKNWKLRFGQYCVALADDIDELRWILKAYKKTKLRKKLILISQNENNSLEKLEKKYSFVLMILAHTNRARQSLIRQAGAVIAGNSSHGTNDLLQAMDSGRPIVAIANSLNEETVGTTTLIVKHGDTDSLVSSIKEIVGKNSAKQLGRKAAKRAKNHFEWKRIVTEYKLLYRKPQTVKVSIDSVIPRPTWHIA